MKLIDKLKGKLQASKEQLALAADTGYEWGYEKGSGRKLDAEED